MIPLKLTHHPFFPELIPATRSSSASDIVFGHNSPQKSSLIARELQRRMKQQKQENDKETKKQKLQETDV